MVELLIHRIIPKPETVTVMPIVPFISFAVFVIGMLIFAFTSYPFQLLGLFVFLATLVYSFVEPRRRLVRKDKSPW